MVNKMKKYKANYINIDLYGPMTYGEMEVEADTEMQAKIEIFNVVGRFRIPLWAQIIFGATNIPVGTKLT